MNTCTFCGHHDTPDSIRPILCATIEKLITESGVDTFYVGNHGSFDRMALSSLREMKKTYPQIKYYVALAYMPEKKEEYPLYSESETVLPDGIEEKPRRFAITYRNKWMVDQSQYLIAYVKHSLGGSSKTLEYASTKSLKILEI